ncbi:hypothetical protein KIH39_03330 [Telmatocola sphagniphila]|uniref:Uncharacterized protein n=1 Tax=Telmatocola sphagniphila TaxID=1123043 RepID=A0A8E6EVR7_9BACT|nr:hypothetical protein [Telmatocola sphagniphila]QVL32962.1 hypothetical protein KIH39_03330 [Telmatocola sphagniphila]
MTEDDWQLGANPEPMLRYLEVRMTDRKMRLFGIACCRRYPLEEGITPAYVKLLDYAEKLADSVEDSEGERIWEKLQKRQDDRSQTSDHSLACLLVAFTGKNEQFFRKGKEGCGTVSDWVREACRLLIERPRHEESRSNRYFREMERMQQADTLREIIGNPFAQTAFDVNWRNTNILDIATKIYEQKEFENLPILADALQDAGCNWTEIIDHLRSSESHFRGCWALDAILSFDAK